MTAAVVVPGVPRNSLIWLLVAQVLVILPLLPQLPLWIAALWLACGAWRLRILRMQAGFPKGWVKALIIIGTGVGVYLSRGGLIGLDAGVVLLVAAFILKLLEMRTRRDGLVVIFLGFFVVVTGFLFEDSLVAGAYSLLPIVALLAAMIGLQQSRLYSQPWPTVRLAGGLVLQAVPLMVVLFVFFPRLPPLWSLPQQQSRATVGLSDHMAPGDIAELSRSTALAFRAEFEADIPPRERLYWRALTFERFDGRRWSRSVASQLPVAPPWTPTGPSVRYSVVMQPSGQPWLFALDVPQVEGGEAQLMPDFHLQRERPVDSPLLYQATSWPDALRQPAATPDTLRRALALPAEGNPRARAWAARLAQRAGTPDALVGLLLAHFNREPYVYTLRPPPVGDEIVDGFLFDTRRGFCIHYAGAMTFVLRAAGVPARVVAGYQGGEIDADGGIVSVRQLDAHAWVEYWVAGQGWRSIDPTFQVAPERIESGLTDALPDERELIDDSPLSLLRYRDIGWLNSLRFGWDRLNHGWQRWVLGYRGDEQRGLLERLFGEADWRLAGLTLVGALAALMTVLSLWLFKPWQRRGDAQLDAFKAFEQALQRHGVRRQPGEGPKAFAARATERLPEHAAAIGDFAARYEALRYAGQAGDAQALMVSLKRLRRELPWRRSSPER